MAINLCKTNEGRANRFVFFPSLHSRPIEYGDGKVDESFLSFQNSTYLTSPLRTASERLRGMAYATQKFFLSMLME